MNMKSLVAVVKLDGSANIYLGDFSKENIDDLEFHFSIPKEYYDFDNLVKGSVQSTFETAYFVDSIIEVYENPIKTGKMVKVVF